MSMSQYEIISVIRQEGLAPEIYRLDGETEVVNHLTLSASNLELSHFSGVIFDVRRAYGKEKTIYRLRVQNGVGEVETTYSEHPFNTETFVLEARTLDEALGKLLGYPVHG